MPHEKHLIYELNLNLGVIARDGQPGIAAMARSTSVCYDTEEVGARFSFLSESHLNREA